MADAMLTQPPLWRVVLAFMLTPAVAATGLACFMPAYDGLPDYWDRVQRTALTFALFGGYPATLVLGLPAYLFLRSRVRATALNCATTGALIASAPWFVLGMMSLPDWAEVGGQATVRNGTMTMYGWINLFQFVGSIALVGAVAGLVFWLLAVGRIGEKPPT